MKKKLTVSEKVENDRRFRKQVLASRDVNRKYKILLARTEALEKEIEAALEIRRGLKTFTIKPQSAKKSEATAVIVASDWHLEEEVKPGAVNHLNTFNLTAAEARSKAFFQNALTLIQVAQKDVSVTEVVLALLGDFISGNIHDELLETCQLLPAYAIGYAQDVLASGIQFLLDNTECHLTIVCTVGNHTRITKKVHIATEEGNSLETFMYLNLARYFRDNKRVTFVIGEGYHTYIDVYGYKLRFHHGHAIRYQGGIGGIYIPAFKAISQWNKAIKCYLDVFGHWHQFRDAGNFICNGSLIGYSAFSLRIKADYERPCQAFFLIDKIRGKTIVAPVLLD